MLADHRDGLSSSSFLAWSSIAQSVRQQAFSLLVNRYLRSWVRILPSAEEDNLSPLDSNIACLCQSIEINNNKRIIMEFPEVITSDRSDIAIFILTKMYLKIFSKFRLSNPTPHPLFNNSKHPRWHMYTSSVRYWPTVCFGYKSGEWNQCVFVTVTS